MFNFMNIFMYCVVKKKEILKDNILLFMYDYG